MQYQQKGKYYPDKDKKLLLPSGYLEKGYFDGENIIKCELLTQLSKQIAELFGDSGITSTQLRRFFTQVRAIERELGRKSFAELVPQIQSLEPAVANYVGKGNNPYEREKREVFKKFIDRNVSLAVKNEINFKKGFVPHFESIVAYFKYLFPNK